MKKPPDSFEATVRCSPVFSFLTVMVAPGTTAPEASAASPTMRPLSA